MRKLLLAVSSFVLLQNTNAQIPVGYYDNAYNGTVPKTCADLKTALFTIITTDTVALPFNSPSGGPFDTRNAMVMLDIHRNDDNTADIMWDMYTDNPTGPELFSFTPNTSLCGGSFQSEVGACYNKEHSFPQAWFNNEQPMRSDMHAMFAADGWTNAKHANWPYAEVDNNAVEWQSACGAKLGNSLTSSNGYTGKVFEPIDEYKGDFARAMFFMVTCYENLAAGWQGNEAADSVLNGTTWPSLDNWAIRQWYKWHVQDPVSQKEITRNDSVFVLQHNRNPFIDHPEYAALIWQCTGLLPVTVTDFTAVKTYADVLLQWNVTMETNFKHYEVERSIDGVTFNKIGVVTAQNKSSYNLTDNSLPDVKTVFYRLKMVDIDGRSTYSKTVSVKLNRRNRDITIYPNPAVSEISITLQQAVQANSMIKITDITGKELLRQNVVAGQDNIKLKVNQLPAGRYFVFVLSTENMLYDSFVIVK